MPDHFMREMGLTPGDFFRALPPVVEGLNYRIAANAVTIAHPEGTIEIALTPCARRCIGALLLPVTRVEFKFSGFSQAGRERFMESLDLHFHRGGG